MSTDSTDLKDKTGAPVRVYDDSEGRGTGAYVIELSDDGQIAGRAYYVDATGDKPGRIFYHTVVDEAFGGRGLASILVSEALEQERALGDTIVPVCPLFVKRLAEHGDEYAASGGTYRKATGADIAAVQAVSGGGE